MLDLELVNLKSVIAQQKIQPYFQNIVDNNRNVVGAEILARWVENNELVFSPDIFIKKFEAKGLLAEITCSLIEQIICFLSTSIYKHTDKFYLSLNITEEVLSDRNFKIYIRQLNKYCNVVLELTENKPIVCGSCIKKNIRTLKSDKLKFAIDDYGIDYSSLMLLYDYQFDILKLDKSFISMLCTDFLSESNYRKKIIIKNIVDLCCSLKIKLIAEGVETLEQELLLKNLGVKYFQGFLYSRPMRIDKLFLILA
ncbi:EAL domain-containing protein [Photobacterium kishitanii]|uniref:EAL domain-containing protein n=1 Tax=Photobacterium kishitanii TaxID=318456 RepID=UPI000435C807